MHCIRPRAIAIAAAWTRRWPADDAEAPPGCTAGVRRSACAAFAPGSNDPPGQRARSRPVLRAGRFPCRAEIERCTPCPRENRYRGKTVHRGGWETRNGPPRLRVSATRRFTQFDDGAMPSGKCTPVMAGVSDSADSQNNLTQKVNASAHRNTCAASGATAALSFDYPRCQRSSTDYRNEQRTCQWVFDLSSTRHRGRRDALHARPWLPVQSIFVQRHRNPQLRAISPALLHGFPTDYRGRPVHPPMERTVSFSGITGWMQAQRTRLRANGSWVEDQLTEWKGAHDFPSPRPAWPMVGLLVIKGLLLLWCCLCHGMVAAFLPIGRPARRLQGPHHFSRPSVGDRLPRRSMAASLSRR